MKNFLITLALTVLSFVTTTQVVGATEPANLQVKTAEQISDFKTGTLQGFVYDRQSGEPMPGVNVTYKDKSGKATGTVTDIDGKYSIELPARSVNLLFSCLGYQNTTVNMVLNPNENRKNDVYMDIESTLLGEVVVSAGRFEQKLSDITVSMDLLKSEQILHQAPTDITSTLNTLPGVDINDRQPSIRGGNGWTYGVGSRCLVLVDGMNALDPGNGTVNWNSLPLENIEQVEVIKGASSVLYGSSALNGIINIRSRRPDLNPVTTFKTYIGIYGNPAEESYRWADRDFWKDNKYPVEPLTRRNIFSGIRNPYYEGADLSHSRRIGNLDLSGSLNLFTDEGYRQQGYNKRFRIGANLCYHHPLKTENMLNYGINIGFLSDQNADFFIWRSPSQVYQPSAFANMGRESNTLDLSPFVNFTNPNKNTSHKVKARFHYRDNGIVQATQPKNIAAILGDMGTDIEGLSQLITDVKGGNISSLMPVIGPLLKKDIPGMVNGATGLLNQYFPTATTADYCDLISFVMKSGIPSDKKDLIPWLSGVIDPKVPHSPIDRDYTYYVDYQFNKKWEKGPNLTTGLTYEHTTLDSQKTGNHDSDNAAIFLQYDQRFVDKVSVSAGMRMEYYRVDNFLREAETKIGKGSIPFRPIFRAGINWQCGTFSFLRASFGQGYRYPSLTEKYARKDIGGVGVFPNHNLKAEKGLNAEIGFKQGYKFGNVKGTVDLSGFYTQYDDMIEFRFGFFNNETFEYIDSFKDVMGMMGGPQSPGLGAQFYNVSRARIYGCEVSTQGIWQANDHTSLTYNLGYVFLEPEDVDYKAKNEREDAYTDPLQMKEKSNNSKYLKYRQRHTAKLVLDFNWKKLDIGLNLVAKSKTLAVDYIMVDERHPAQPFLNIDPVNGKVSTEYTGDYKPQVMDYVRDLLFGVSGGENLASYWAKHNKPYCILDLRLGYKFSDKISGQFSVNNVLNTEYSTRPMAVAAPRSFIVQLNFKI